MWCSALASLDDDRAQGGSFGAVVGRDANRIAGASFALGGTRHHLAANEGASCLHGGAPDFRR